ncbi:MAG: hypothetical protein ACRETC_10695 [Gammaproteobacteria bacterium]
MSILLTQVRRELWENRGHFYILIAILFGLIVLASAVFGIAVGGGFTGMHPTGHASGAGVAMLGLGIGHFIYMIYSASLLGYLSGTLYDDRKDGSVLFWRSLPVSDTTVVAGKVLTAGIVGPFFVWIAVVLGHLIALLALATAASARGAVGFSVFASPGALFGTWGFFAYALAIQTLWWLPYYGWFLFVSAASLRGKPFIWAVLPPLIVGLGEMLINHTLHVFQFLSSHLVMSPVFNGWPIFGVTDDNGMINAITQSAASTNPLYSGAGWVSHFLAMPSMWIGVAIGLVLLALAVVARRYSATA